MSRRNRRVARVGDLGRKSRGALAAFDPVWEALSPRERVRLVESLIERVDFDRAGGSVSVTFHPTGIRTLETLAEAKE